jgi:hypothetical protein
VGRPVFPHAQASRSLTLPAWIAVSLLRSRGPSGRPGAPEPGRMEWPKVEASQPSETDPRITGRQFPLALSLHELTRKPTKTGAPVRPQSAATGRTALPRAQRGRTVLPSSTVDNEPSAGVDGEVGCSAPRAAVCSPRRLRSGRPAGPPRCAIAPPLPADGWISGPATRTGSGPPPAAGADALRRVSGQQLDSASTRLVPVLGGRPRRAAPSAAAKQTQVCRPRITLSPSIEQMYWIVA